MTRHSGFTLVELMIVVLIIGILSAIAIPSYRNHVLRVNRTDAKVGATTAAQVMERCYTRTNTYVGCDVAYPLDTQNATYTIAFNPAPTAIAFTVTATPINGQADDTACGTFSLNQVGQQTVSGPKPASECW